MRIRRLGDEVEVWDGKKWCSGLRGWGDDHTVYLLADDFANIQRRNTMSTSERTVTINHVTLTEAQLREGLWQLEQPTSGSIKAGTYFTCEYDWASPPRVRMKLSSTALMSRPDGVMYVYTDTASLGNVGWDLPDTRVRVVEGSFHVR